MDERAAQEIVRMVESGWSCDFGMQGRTLWCRMLYDYDAELATQAVVEMSRNPLPGGRFKPQVSDLRQIILSLKRGAAVPTQLEEGKRGVVAPEWFHVWNFARQIRDPREERSFPQQEGHGDPTNMMSKVEYETLRKEWIAAGRPKSKHLLPMVGRA
jgi:hypothetical protein